MSLLKHTTLNFNEPERHHFEDNITIFGEAFLCLNSLCKVSACVFFNIQFHKCELRVTGSNVQVVFCRMTK